MAVEAQASTSATAGVDETTLRTCVVTRSKRPPEELLRFVEAPDGRIVPDLARRLPGRGVWVTAERQTVIEAVKKNAFAKSLRRRVVVPPELPDQIEQLLRRRLVEALSLTNKAGLVTTGYDRVDAALERGRVEVLLHGLDASDDGRSRLDRKFRAIARDRGREALIVRVLTSDELSLALGRPNVVHAALSAGGATDKFLNEARRVIRFRAGSPATDDENAARSRAAEDYSRAGKV
jgi:predicted RNA-binding protein YlxR (DUF448 family)